MKPSGPTPPPYRVDRSVAWWSALLLIVLGTVLAALFLSARLVLSLANEQGLEQSKGSGRAYHTFAAAVLLLRDDAPNRSERARRHW